MSISTDCIQVVENIGSSVYHDLCSGTTHILVWGAITWIGFFALMIALVVSVIFLMSMIMVYLNDHFVRR